MTKWYWVIQNSSVLDDPFVGDTGFLGEFDDADLHCRGEVLSWANAAWVASSTADNDGQPDDALQNCFGLPVFSIRLQKALSENGILGIQWLPIRVRQSNQLAVDGYAIANILACVSALDVKRSKLSRFKEDWIVPERRGQISAIQKAVLIRRVVNEFDIVRLCEFPPAMYVSEKFRRTFIKGGFTGLDFVEVALSDAPESGT